MPPTLVDTHCHIHFDAFDADRDAVIKNAQEAGVRYLVNVGTDAGTNQKACDLAKRHPFMRFSAGLHPHSAHEATEEVLKELETFIREKRPAAIGEVGLDYFKSEAQPEIQKKVFARMLQIAVDTNTPVIVHSRNAFKDTADIIRQESGGKLKGVIHCFSYGKEELKTILDLGFFASFTANITYKTAGTILEAACFAPLDHIMLETDSPYLAPQNLRGQRNEPAFMVHHAEFLAKKRGVSLESLCETTTKTALSFFKFKTLP